MNATSNVQKVPVELRHIEGLRDQGKQWSVFRIIEHKQYCDNVWKEWKEWKGGVGDSLIRRVGTKYFVLVDCIFRSKETGEK